MTNQDPAAIVTQYFDALRLGDVPGALSLFSPTVVWHQSGAHRFSGEHHGPDGVGALLGGFMDVSNGSFQLSVTGPAMVNGERVAVPVRFSGHREGAEMDMAGVDLLTVTEGRIVAVHLFSEDQKSEDAFWGQI